MRKRKKKNYTPISYSFPAPTKPTTYLTCEYCVKIGKISTGEPCYLFHPLEDCQKSIRREVKGKR